MPNLNTFRISRRLLTVVVTLSAMLATLTVLVPSASAQTPTCLGLAATIIGTDGPDTLNGTSGDDVIVGLGGDDLIIGKAGNDIICAGDGADKVYGWGGNDTIDLGERDASGEIIASNLHQDKAWGGQGDDTIISDGGNDKLYGSAGNDTLEIVEWGVAKGGDGDDHFTGGKSTRLFGQDGHDTFTITRASTIYGGDGDDTVFMNFEGAPASNQFPNRVWVGNGNDTVIDRGVTNSRIDGGPGNDRILSGFQGGWDDVGGQRVYIGGTGDDWLSGSRQGNEKLRGGEGNDLIEGGPGNDLLFGGDGDDFVISDGRWEFGVGASDVIRGGDGDDTCADQGVTAIDEATNTFSITWNEFIQSQVPECENALIPGTDYPLPANISLIPTPADNLSQP